MHDAHLGGSTWVLLGLGYGTGGLWELSEGCGSVQEGWPRALRGSALKEMQGRISTEKAELSLPRADEKRCYKVTGLW